jgi:WD40 repeat protein/serine/threonine protein kinase
MEVCPACLLSAALDPTGDASSRGSDLQRMDAATTASVPEAIGPYRILGRLGAGGMGEVYLAEQSRPLRRRVAVKIIKRGMDTEQVIARFESERQALALMNHPNIARVFDAGEQDGRPYFVMEYVPGIPITEYCDRQRLTTRERLGLFTVVCQAVQHAHQKGIIHRDLKPSNVLVAVQDGQPVPKVIDFGVAKATDHRLTERTLFTQHGLLVGTPEYMSPEQAELTGLDVDTRTDIYSLGVLLYELLVGTLPFDAQSLRRAGFDEMRRIIREDDPVKPSTRISSLGEAGAEIAKRRHTDLKSLGKQLRGDLEWITLKALEKNPTLRYSTASEFAGDIERHLAGDPVLAGPPGIAYRMQKLVLKHRRVAAALAVGIIGLTIATLISTGLYVRSERFRRAEEWQSYVANVRAAAAALEEGATADARRRLEAAPARLRNWEWHYLWERLDLSIAVLSANHGPVLGVRFSPDGSRLIAYTANLVDEWNPATRALLRSNRPGKDGDTIVSVSPDGTKAVLQRPTAREKSVSWSQVLEQRLGWDDSRLAQESRLVNVATGETLVSLMSGSLVKFVEWTPDAKRLLVLSIKESFLFPTASIQMWDVERGESIGTWTATDGLGVALGCRPVSISRYGDYFAASTEIERVNVPGRFYPNGTPIVQSTDGVGVFDLHGRLLAKLPIEEVCSIGFEQLTDAVVLTSENAVKFWHWTTAAQASDANPAGPFTGSFVARDNGVFTAENATLRWLPPDEPRDGRVHGHSARITDVTMSPDGAMLATSSEDGTIRLWATSRVSGRDGRALKIGGDLVAVTAGRVLTTDLQVADLDTGQKLISTGQVRSILRRPEPGPPSRTLAELVTSTASPPTRESYPVVAALSADGVRVAASETPGTIVVFDVDRGRELAELKGDWGEVFGLAFAPSGDTLVSAARDGRIRTWSVSTGTAVNVMNAAELISAVVVSPDGSRAAAGSIDGAVSMWDIQTGSRVRTLTGHTDGISSIVFSSDGTTLVTGSLDGTVRVWDTATGKSLHRLVHTGPVSAVSVSPDGSRLASSSIVPSRRLYDGVARLWDLASGELLLAIRPPAMELSISFAPDGRSIVVGGDAGVRVWETRVGSGTNRITK